VTIANNALYAQAGNAIAASGTTTGLIVAGNRGVGALAGVSAGFTASTLAGDLVSGGYGGAPPMDLFPAAGSSLIGAGDPAYAVAIDFNGVARGASVDVGAYAFAAAGNPGWELTTDFKGFPAGSGGVDAGVDGGGDEAGGCCQTGGAPGAPLALGLLVIAALRRRRRVS
jgi:MYXO-CTERM domain-containing protein